ncbi:MAG: nucleoside-diphosphate-sugar pyrophosphorylase [Desulfobacteraceae bacterium]|nr:MAG: nucleoside-diphosphate-sugar pyrophosphorylase [Desulfobacteraceae bacterium]
MVIRMESGLGVVILAAGLGTRMKSDKAKVLHEICGIPMIQYVVGAATEAAGSNVVVVVGHQAEMVRQAASCAGPVHFALQERQLGTGHAVICALPSIPAEVKQVVILCGDVPLIRKDTIERLVSDHIAHARDLSVLVVEVENPKGYGRIVLNAEGELSAVVEEADADATQKKINIINTGIYIVKRAFLETALPQLRADNAQKEIYLTDIIGIAYREGRTIGAVKGSDSSEIIGVNSRDDLRSAETVMKVRIGEKS